MLRNVPYDNPYDNHRRVFLEHPTNATKYYYMFPLNSFATNPQPIPLGTFTGILPGQNNRDYRIMFSSYDNAVNANAHIIVSNAPLDNLPTYAQYMRQVFANLDDSLAPLPDEYIHAQQPAAPQMQQQPLLPPVPQAVVPQAVVPQAVVQPPPGPLLALGQAYEIHNHFNDLNFVKIMEIIRRENTMREIAPVTVDLLEPLIDYATSFSEQKAEGLTRINQVIQGYQNKDVQAIRDTIQFVLSQPEDFKKTYINNFSEDCLFAYEVDPTRPNASRVSCTKGQYERVFMSLQTVLEAHCRDNPDETICPPFYRELLLCFKPDYNALFAEWFDTQDPDTDGFSGKTPEQKRQYIQAKKAELRAFIVGRIGERTSINAYLNKMINGKSVFESVYDTYAGGRRKQTNKSNKRKGKSRKNKKSKKMKKRSGKK